MKDMRRFTGATTVERWQTSRTTTRGAGAGGVLVALVVAMLVALALSGNALAEEGGNPLQPPASTPPPAPMQCAPTGLESVATDKEDYNPGELVTISGAGYAPSCAVEIKVHRPDGTVDAVSATTDLGGNVAAEYQLPGMPAVIGLYVLKVHGLDGAELATVEFLDANVTFVTNSNLPTVGFNTGAAAASSITINRPAVVGYGQLMIAQIAVDGGSGVTITEPAGWTLIPGTRVDNGANVGHGVYYKFAGTSEPASYQWGLSPNSRAVAGFASYTGVDEANPILAVGSANTGNSTNRAALGVNYSNASGAKALAFYTSDADTAHGQPGGTTERWDVNQTGTTQPPTASAVDVNSTPATGPTATFTATGGTSAQWVAQQLVLNPDRRATHAAVQSGALVIPVPDDAEEDDLLLAQITVEGGTDTAITPPAGWTFIRRDNASSNVGTALYGRFASGSEPASYSWGVGGKKAAGGILAYADVFRASGTPPVGDPTLVLPSIDAHSGAAPNTSTTTATAPTVTTEFADSTLVLFVGVKGNRSLTPNSGMRERYDVNPSDLPTAEAADQIVAAIGATGARSAIWSGSETWTAQLVALRMGSNTAPTATAQTATLNEDATKLITLAGTDPETDPLTFKITSLPANGKLYKGNSTAPADEITTVPTALTGTQVTYKPNANYVGADSFQFKAHDGDLDSTLAATVSLTVDPVNDAPSFTKGADVSVDEDSGEYTQAGWATAILEGPANESSQDVEFEVTDNTNAALFSVAPAVSATGELTFTPADDASGTATITLKLTDDGGIANGGVDESAEQTFVITVDALNDVSVAEADSYSTDEDVLLEVAAPGLLGNDTDAEEGTLEALLVDDVTNGTLTLNADGSFTYQPNENFNGSDSFTYKANDGEADSEVVTVEITVNPVNDAPSFTQGADVTVNEDSAAYSAAWAADVSAGPADESGQQLTFTVANDNEDLFSTQPALAADGTLTFEPAADANGSAEVTVTLSDDGGTDNDGDDSTDAVAFTITVTAVNDAPSFTAGADVTVAEDSVAYSAAWATDVSAGPANESAQVLTFAASNDDEDLFATQPALAADGTLSFEPAADANGSALVTVSLSDDGGTDNGGDDSTDEVTFTITVTAVNDAPVADDDSAATDEDASVTVDVVDNDVTGPANESGQTLTVGNVSDPEHGTATDNGDGTITYEPDADYFGADSFTYEVCDDGSPSLCDEATVSITVNAVNDAPVAAADGASTDEDTFVDIDVVANDTDIDDPNGELLVAAGSIADVTGGTAELQLDGRTVRFTPAEDANDDNTLGGFSFTYKVTDGELDSAEAATVTIDVTPVNDAPVAVAEEAATDEDTAVSTDVVANDTDVDDDNADLDVVAGSLVATNGVAVLEADGRTITFTPDLNKNDDNTPAGFEVTYKVIDGELESEATATLTISVAAVNDTPEVAVDQAAVTVDEGTTAANIGTWSDVDAVDGDDVTLTASVGEVVENPDGTWSWSYATTDGPDESQTVTITAEDEAGETAETTFALTVDNVAPTVAFTDGPTEVDESGTAMHTFSYSISDPGDDTVDSVLTSCGTGGVKVDGSDTNTDDGGSFQCRFPDGPAGPVVTAQATDSDGAAGNTAEHAVNVDNVAPTVSLIGDDEVDEGDQRTYSFTVTDPGDDTFAVDDHGCGDFGELVAGSLAVNSSGGSFSCVFPDGDEETTVSIEVSDEDGASTDDSHDIVIVEIANVPPTVTFDEGLAVEVLEGSTHTYSYEISDPGEDTVDSVAVSCGDNGTLSEATNDDVSGSFKCTFPDGPASSTVTAQATDSDGAAGNTAELEVAVANVAPVVELTGSGSADEGDTETYTYTVTDAGDDPSPTIVESCGENATLVVTAAVNSFDCTFPDGPESSEVKVTADDGDPADNVGSDTIEVSVANVAPVVTLTGPDESEEGETQSYSYTVEDPGDETFTRDAQSCGTGGVVSNAAFDADTGAGSFDCTFPDGPETYAVSVEVSDGTVSDTDSIDVDVTNVAPTVAITGGPTEVDESATAEHTFTFAVDDPGTDTFSVLAGYPTCGLEGQLVAGSLATTAAGGTFECRFPDGPATSLVAVKVEDSDGAESNEATSSVAVDNVAPTIAFTGGATEVDESGTEEHVYSYSISDPGADTIVEVATDCGDGGTKVVDSDDFSADTSGTFKCTFPDGPAAPVVSAQVTDSDDAPSNTITTGVTVANVAPTVAFDAGLDTESDEGETHTYSFTISDPGDDTVDSVAVSCGDAGDVVVGSSTEDDVSGSFDCTFPDGPESSTLTVQATDSDSDAGNTAELEVAVANVAPKVDLVGDTQVDEGDSATYSFTVVDPGDDAYSVDAFGCGDDGALVSGSFEAGPAGGEFRCRFPDGNAETTVSITVSDEDGASTTDSHDVVVVEILNVAPTVTFAAGLPTSVDEGSTHTYSYTISDPGEQDLQTVTPSCGTAGVVSDAANTSTAGSFKCTFPNGPEGSTVSAQATDSDGAAGNTAELAVTVTNVAPTVTLDSGLVTETDEGQTHTYSYTISDPGVGDTVTSVDVSCGSGGTVSEATNGNESGSFKCTFPEGPATTTVSAQATDSDGDAGNEPELEVTVANLAPVVDITTPTAGFLSSAGNPVTVSATFTDAGRLDTHSCTINGAPGVVTEVNGSGTCQGSATPSSSGSFTITVVVTDDDGASGSDSVSGFGLYAIYANEKCSGGFGKGLVVNGAGADIDGQIHSNGNFKLDGTNFNSYTASIFRSSSNNCSASYTSKNVNFGAPSPKAPVTESTARTWPRYFNRSEFTCTHPVKEEYSFNKQGQVIPAGVYCATKTFKINGANISGNITVLAPEIVLNGKNISLWPYAKDMLLYNINPATGALSNKEIVFNPADVVRGMVFNPGGGIKINGSSARFVNGFLHAQFVEINGSSFRMEYTG
jgi:large repetitive protein